MAGYGTSIRQSAFVGGNVISDNNAPSSYDATRPITGTAQMDWEFDVNFGNATAGSQAQAVFQFIESGTGDFDVNVTRTQGGSTYVRITANGNDTDIAATIAVNTWYTFKVSVAANGAIAVYQAGVLIGAPTDLIPGFLASIDTLRMNAQHNTGSASQVRIKNVKQTTYV